MSGQCETMSLLLWRRIDGEAMSTTQSKGLDEHLDQCDACQADAELFKNDDAMLFNAFSSLRSNDALNDKVLQAIAEERKSAPLFTSNTSANTNIFLRFAPLAAAAVVIAWFVFSAPKNDGALKNSVAVLASTKSDGLRVRQNGQWMKLSDGQNIEDGAVLANRQQRPSTIEFSNKTRVTLRADTTIKVSKASDGATEIDLTSGSGGEIMCSVTPGYGSFRVRAKGMLVTVLGTKFLVRSYQNLTRVVVIEGKVRCETDTVETVITNEQEAELASNLRIQVGQADLSKRLHWVKKASSSTAPIRPAVNKVDRTPVRQPDPVKPTKPNPPNPGMDMPVSPPNGGKGK
ncbi:MAG: FecR domain-containing protein [Planctomycetota bacterium]|nr:FecR domain-containing protein [Planctomycetota bacterium]